MYGCGGYVGAEEVLNGAEEKKQVQGGRQLHRERKEHMSCHLQSR